MKNKKWPGILMVLISSVLWGVSGTVSQYLFNNAPVSVSCVVSIRMFTAGIMLIIISVYKGNKDKVIEIWKNKYSRFHLIVYTIFGMLGVQFTYFTTIAKSNAAIATLLQYLSPVIIIIFYLIRLKQKSAPAETAALFMALGGAFLLLTNGRVESLAISPEALLWGIASAFALAFYTVYVKKLLKWPSSVIIGWSMIIGCFILGLFVPDWVVLNNFARSDILLSMIFIVILGTLIPFYFFIESLRYINAKEASLLSCTEPLSALVTSIIWLHVSFGIYQFAGTFLIVLMIVMLTLTSKTKQSN